MSGIKVKKVIHYAVMPEMIPRLVRLFTSGFGYVAFLMAQIYNMVRLLPNGHPYLNAQNTGQFGIRHVIAEAANNLVISRKNIDQIIIFIALLMGIALLAMQIILLFTSLVFQSAFAAAPSNPGSIFVTAAPAKDIAFMLLDQVFGIPDMFKSCISTGAACSDISGPPSTTAFPFPFHLALHDLLRFYSSGMLVVGALIFLYFVVVVVAETATTGTPFGQRFQNIWVPIRLVVAIGLLVPINYGLNTSQFIALFSAKLGSSLATNGWLTYNDVIKDKSTGAAQEGANPTGEVESLIGFPEPPDISAIVQAMSIVHSCAFAHWVTDEGVKDSDPKPPDSRFYIKPYFIKQPSAASFGGNTDSSFPVTSGTSYDTALEFYNNSDIVIRFGRAGFTSTGGGGGGGGSKIPIKGLEEDAAKALGNVIPSCGDIRIKIASASDTAANGGNGTRIGPEAVQEFYYNLIIEMWFDQSEFVDFAQRYTVLGVNNERLDACEFGNGGTGIIAGAAGGGDCRIIEPSNEWKQNIVDEYQSRVNGDILGIWNEYAKSIAPDVKIKDEVLERGWGGAGIWYTTIARINGAFMEAVINVPTLEEYPIIMEKVRTERRREDSSTSPLYQFQPNISNSKSSNVLKSEKEIAKVLNVIYIYWNKDASNLADSSALVTSGGLEDAMNLIFGTQGLFSMSRNNNHVYPLAQLAMLGKGLVEASIRNVAAATVVSGVGGLFRMIDNTSAALIDAIAKFIVSTAFIGLTAGLVLFYIVPFLPFIYFFFAVGEWIKAIFEAMVGAPLWALAHLRIDGDGLPGSSASNGYFLILEIMIRPILTIFGLIAATVIFTAQIRILNFTWGLVTSNLGGFDGNTAIGIAGKTIFERNTIDAFFFTIIYAIIVYMMALAAFKLINKIPDNILRWMGASVSSFGDINDNDPAEGLTRFAALGGVTAGREITTGVQELGGGLGGAVAGLARPGGR